MKTKLLLLGVVLLFLPLLSHSQTEVELSIYVSPTYAFVKINDQIVEGANNNALKKVKLPEGKHVIAVWAPEFTLVTDTIEVKAGKMNIHKIALRELSPEFKAYKEKKEDYQTQKTAQIAINAAVVVGNTALLWVALDGTKIRELDQLKGRAELDKQLYESSIVPENITANKRNYEISVEEYNKTRDQLTLFRAIGIPVFLASTYFSYKFLKKYNRKKNELKKPEFNPENPLTNLDLGFENNQFVVRYHF